MPLLSVQAPSHGIPVSTLTLLNGVPFTSVTCPEILPPGCRLKSMPDIFGVLAVRVSGVAAKKLVVSCQYWFA